MSDKAMAHPPAEDRAGHEPSPYSRSRPVGDHPLRDRPFAEEFPHLTGCLKTLALYGALYGLLAIIIASFGWVAAFWFALGGLGMGLVAMWEIGGKAIAMEARQGGNAEERSHAKHDSAGPKDIAQGTSHD